MGITKFSVVQRYINFSKTEKVEQFERATINIAGAHDRPERTHSGSEATELINQLLGLAPGGRERAWSAFIQGLKALFSDEEPEPLSEAREVVP